MGLEVRRAIRRCRHRVHEAWGYDHIARQAGIEPYEVRLRSLVQPDQMPFDNVAAIDVEGVRRRQKRGEPDGRLIGVGFAIFCEQGAAYWQAGDGRSSPATNLPSRG